jgi:hypothetical protein
LQIARTGKNTSETFKEGKNIICANGFPIRYVAIATGSVKTIIAREVSDDRRSTGSPPETVSFIQGAGRMLVRETVHVIIQ